MKGIPMQEQATLLADDPTALFNHSITQMQSTPWEALSELQLQAARMRFDALRNTVPMLTVLADKQGVCEILGIEDLVPLLFKHSMFKSYPPSLLQKNRFDQINRWLSKLTVYDLTAIDVSHCTGIDDWLRIMDRESPLRICHSSGTTGTLSLLPISKEELERAGRYIRLFVLRSYGDDRKIEPDEGMHVINPGYRHGGSQGMRHNEVFLKYLALGEDRYHAAYDRMSSDALYLAGQIGAAKARGQLHRLAVSPTLQERKEEFDRLQANAANDLQRFLARMTDQLAGERVFLSGNWNILYDFSKAGLATGRKNVFAPDSVALSGGGAKGMVPPENWQQTVCEFTGIERIHMSYGMSETMAMHMLCEHDRYHLSPWVIPFVLDPDTGESLPRIGAVTGRAAFYDLSQNSRWGGYISGDEVTIDWDCSCPCGRTTPHYAMKIERYSEKRGGDDKITCAATPEAHQEAMDFLADMEVTI